MMRQLCNFATVTIKKTWSGGYVNIWVHKKHTLGLNRNVGEGSIKIKLYPVRRATPSPRSVLKKEQK